ncbi:DUF3231 family protein [Bacillus fonticola]|uniref:DUF3231 family protein n=1 Tax=Bacillus fonticola TaxID=2728853 RepID=UPI0014745308|nr:DUF3231 family protein [Bacillus fonticola]
MENQHQAKLSSSELSQLWVGYTQDTLTVCTMKYFLQIVEDPDIRPIIEQALALSETHVQKLTALFQLDKRPVPIGFTEQDVNVMAPRLYSDPFLLDNVKQTTQLGMQMYSQAIALCARHDVRQYFSDCLQESLQLYNWTIDTLLSKGLFVRSPYIDTPNQVDFVTKQHFMSGWVGKQRPLLSLEIANLYANLQRNALGTRLLTGFSQVVRSKKIQEYMIRGKEISSKHLQVFSKILQENDLPASIPWDEGVTDSTVPPFSDKLMLFQVTSMNALGVAYYGTAVSTTFRRDLLVDYTRLIAEIGKYAEDGANLLIENGWMEEPPRMIDHDGLAKR